MQLQVHVQRNIYIIHRRTFAVVSVRATLTNRRLWSLTSSPNHSFALGMQNIDCLLRDFEQFF